MRTRLGTDLHHTDLIGPFAPIIDLYVLAISIQISSFSKLEHIMLTMLSFILDWLAQSSHNLHPKPEVDAMDLCAWFHDR